MKQLLIFAVTIISIFFTACSNYPANEEAIAAPAELPANNDNNPSVPTPVSENSAILPDFTVQDVNGKSINLQHFKGKKVFINLWATWCPPCRREMPSIENLYNTVDKNKVVFVMLSLDDSFNKAKTYIKQEQLSLPVYYPAENMPSLFNVTGIPTTFIFDESGKLIRRIDGSDNYNTDAYKTMLR